MAVLAAAVFIAESALSETLTVHLQAPRFRALAEEGLHAGCLLFQDSQLWVIRHRALLHQGLLS